MLIVESLQLQFPDFKQTPSIFQSNSWQSSRQAAVRLQVKRQVAQWFFALELNHLNSALIRISLQPWEGEGLPFLSEACVPDRAGR